MYKVKEASGDAYISAETQRVKGSNLGKGHTTLWRGTEGEVVVGGWGVQCSSGLMVYCMRSSEITSGIGGKKTILGKKGHFKSILSSDWLMSTLRIRPSRDS